jgi:LuxR family transcriptional regulator, quorum-sensing system regulator BjaR1
MTFVSKELHPRRQREGIASAALFPILESLDRASTLDGLRDALLESLMPYGFKGFTIAIDRRLKSLSVTAAVLATWPKGTNERYAKSGLFHGDPVQRQTHLCTEPFVWDLSIYDRSQEDHRQLYELRRQLGITGGIVVPVMEKMGGRTIMTISGIDFPSCSQTLLMLRVILEHAMARINLLRSTGSRAEPHTAFVKEVSLSSRERQVLGWIAFGKSSKEVAAIMDISEHTVNDHITSAVGKLQASNRTDAVIRAVMLDDLSLG